jgi:LysR family transcriptional regulator, transcriptional activator of nhaA
LIENIDVIAMDPRRLNYLHLLYLRTVIREGSIRQAAEQLHVTPQTISGQLRLLERQLGVRLLQRRGRGVVPTEMGRRAMAYADEIFRLGDELLEEMGEGGGLPSLRVGVNALLPRLLVRRILAPVLEMSPPPRLVCL